MRNYFGLAIILFGVFFLLQQLNVPGAERLLSSWWPLVVIAVGLGAWSSNRKHLFGPMIIVLVGVIALLDQWNIFHQSAWNLFWPIVIVLVGLKIVLGKAQPSTNDHMSSDTGNADVNLLFSGLDRKVVGEVKQGSISCWFAGAKLDMREAQFPQDCTINVSVGFGGVEILVPKTVKVMNQATGILGGSENSAHADATAVRTLTVTGSALFGGLHIRN